MRHSIVVDNPRTAEMLDLVLDTSPDDWADVLVEYGAEQLNAVSLEARILSDRLVCFHEALARAAQSAGVRVY